MVDTVKRIRKEIGHQIPIGVEPYITKLRYVDELYSSGADEIKVNVESFNREIITNVCPDMEYDKILSVLAYSPRIFGKNKVCSNVIVGLGETDAEVVKGVEWMAKIGVVANLRPLYINPYRRRDIAEATQKKASRPSAARMLKLALNYKSILEAHDLKTSLFQTMCYKCTGCEIAPQQDI
jgi:biotin synthase-related radical SAM superfamily protein